MNHRTLETWADVSDIAMRATALIGLLSLPGLLADPACEDSPALTTIWESTSTGNTDRLIDTLIQNHDFASHRAGDCRGPVFWAFEFKNVDALALYTHLAVDLDQKDNDEKGPKEFFDGTEDDLAEFMGEAKAKIEELSALLAEREEEFYSFKNDGVRPASALRTPTSSRLNAAAIPAHRRRRSLVVHSRTTTTMTRASRPTASTTSTTRTRTRTRRTRSREQPLPCETFARVSLIV